MASMMGGMEKKPKPRLHINARVSEYGDDLVEEYDDSKYLKEDLARCKATIKKIQSELDTFIPEDVAAKVRGALTDQLESEKNRVEEIRLRIKHAKKKRARRSK